jgi:hypothetical protein
MGNIRAIEEGLAELEDDVDEHDPSGPFCRHWIPGGCAADCTCGHPCDRHWKQGGGCDACGCDAFGEVAADG